MVGFFVTCREVALALHSKKLRLELSSWYNYLKQSKASIIEVSKDLNDQQNYCKSMKIALELHNYADNSPAVLATIRILKAYSTATMFSQDTFYDILNYFESVLISGKLMRNGKSYPQHFKTIISNFICSPEIQESINNYSIFMNSEKLEHIRLFVEKIKNEKIARESSDNTIPKLESESETKSLHSYLLLKQQQHNPDQANDIQHTGVRPTNQPSASVQEDESATERRKKAVAAQTKNDLGDDEMRDRAPRQDQSQFPSFRKTETVSSYTQDNKSFGGEFTPKESRDFCEDNKPRRINQIQYIIEEGPRMNDHPYPRFKELYSLLKHIIRGIKDEKKDLNALLWKICSNDMLLKEIRNFPMISLVDAVMRLGDKYFRDIVKTCSVVSRDLCTDPSCLKHNQSRINSPKQAVINKLLETVLTRATHINISLEEMFVFIQNACRDTKKYVYDNVASFINMHIFDLNVGLMMEQIHQSMSFERCSPPAIYTVVANMNSEVFRSAKWAFERTYETNLEVFTLLSNYLWKMPLDLNQKEQSIHFTISVMSREIEKGTLFELHIMNLVNILVERLWTTKNDEVNVLMSIVTLGQGVSHPSIKKKCFEQLFSLLKSKQFPILSFLGSLFGMGGSLVPDEVLNYLEKEYLDDIDKLFVDLLNGSQSSQDVMEYLRASKDSKINSIYKNYVKRFINFVREIMFGNMKIFTFNAIRASLMEGVLKLVKNFYYQNGLDFPQDYSQSRLEKSWANMSECGAIQRQLFELLNVLLSREEFYATAPKMELQAIKQELSNPRGALTSARIRQLGMEINSNTYLVASTKLYLLPYYRTIFLSNATKTSYSIREFNLACQIAQSKLKEYLRSCMAALTEDDIKILSENEPQLVVDKPLVSIGVLSSESQKNKILEQGNN